MRLDESVTKNSLVFSEEESFWQQMIEDKLNPKNDTINNIAGLKDSLRDLRNTAVLVLLMVNGIWMALMMLLAKSTSSSLDVFGTNPLGLMFLLIYGGLFAIQFITLLWHRCITLLQLVAGVDKPWARHNTDLSQQPFDTDEEADRISHHSSRSRPGYGAINNV
jgi:chitin synthase